MAWTSVSKKLPQVNHIVIGYTSIGRMLFTWVDGGTKELEDQDLHEAEKFTHWAEKPKAPRLKTNSNGKI